MWRKPYAAYLRLILRAGAGRVAKNGAGTRASLFETQHGAALLTMKGKPAPAAVQHKFFSTDY
jgi:hypothetical protein